MLLVTILLITCCCCRYCFVAGKRRREKKADVRDDRTVIGDEDQDIGELVAVTDVGMGARLGEDDFHVIGEETDFFVQGTGMVGSSFSEKAVDSPRTEEDAFQQMLHNHFVVSPPMPSMPSMPPPPPMTSPRRDAVEGDEKGAGNYLLYGMRKILPPPPRAPFPVPSYSLFAPSEEPCSPSKSPRRDRSAASRAEHSIEEYCAEDVFGDSVALLVLLLVSLGLPRKLLPLLAAQHLVLFLSLQRVPRQQ